jgi:hypothetical protein
MARKVNFDAHQSEALAMRNVRDLNHRFRDDPGCPGGPEAVVRKIRSGSQYDPSGRFNWGVYVNASCEFANRWRKKKELVRKELLLWPRSK